MKRWLTSSISNPREGRANAVIILSLGFFYRIRNGLCWFFIEPEKEAIVDREGLCPLQKPKEIWITCLYSFHLKLISEMNTYCFPLGVHFTGYTPENKEAIMKPSWNDLQFSCHWRSLFIGVTVVRSQCESRSRWVRNWFLRIGNNLVRHKHLRPGIRWVGWHWSSLVAMVTSHEFRQCFMPR